MLGGRLSWTSPRSLLYNKVLIVIASLCNVHNLCVFSLRLTAVLSSSQSTHLARSWARRTERSCTPAVAASTLTVWTCCRNARTMTRSAQSPTTTLWVNVSWLSPPCTHLSLSLLAVFDVLWNFGVQNMRGCDRLTLGPALCFLNKEISLPFCPLSFHVKLMFAVFVFSPDCNLTYLFFCSFHGCGRTSLAS